MRMGRAAPASGLVAVASALMLTGCASVRQMQFVEDRRVEFVAPHSQQKVAPPITFRWTSSIPAGQRYALFLGGEIPRPGKGFKDLDVVKKDPQCRVDPNCPDITYLNDLSIFVTDKTSVMVPQVPAQPPGQPPLIEARLILVDAQGRRQGESSWYVRFLIKVP